MNEPLGVLATPYAGFFALVAIGGLTGLLVCKLACVHHWFVTSLLVGIAGSWLGSELCLILGLATRGSTAYFLGAVAGSLAIIWSWKTLHPE